MEKVNNNGHEYTRINNGKWVDSSYMIVHETKQRELNKQWLESISAELDNWDNEKLIEVADALKKSASYASAIALYEKVLDNCNDGTAKSIFPRITSCYRKNKEPQKAIALFERLKEKTDVDTYNSVLLTSVAAAYCDCEDIENAEKCKNLAVRNSKGKISEELDLVIKRINKCKRNSR